MTLTFALIGATALWLLYAWLACCILSGWLAGRKGYSEKAGLATSMLLFFIGPIIWLAWPARPESAWKREGPLPKRRRAGIGP